MNLFLKKLCATAFLLGALSMPVLAQDADMQSLVDRLERMDRDIKSLNLKVYRGTDSVASTTGEELSGPLGSRLSVKTNQLESQLRELTGQLEETAYRITQMSTRLDKLVADVDYRLTALEGGNPSARPDLGNLSSLQNKQAPTTGGIKSQTLTAPSPSQVQPSFNAPKPGTLGTLNGRDLKQPNLQAGTAKPEATQLPVTSQSAKAAGPALDATQLTPEALYDGSRQMLLRGNFAGAETSFKSFLETHKDHKLSGNVRYWLGETYYAQRDFNQAAAVFLEGYQKTPRGAKAPDSLLKLGMSLSHLEKSREACATFGKLRSDFPKLPAHLSKTLERERTNAKCK